MSSASWRGHPLELKLTSGGKSPNMSDRKLGPLPAWLLSYFFNPNICSFKEVTENVKGRQGWVNLSSSWFFKDETWNRTQNSRFWEMEIRRLFAMQCGLASLFVLINNIHFFCVCMCVHAYIIQKRCHVSSITLCLFLCVRVSSWICSSWVSDRLEASKSWDTPVLFHLTAKVTGVCGHPSLLYWSWDLK